MATLSALMMTTKSPPSTFGVNVGLCLPRSRLAAATASRPSTTSVASMTYHVRVVSPAFGVYVGTALTSRFGGASPDGSRCDPGAGQAVTAVVVSATDIDPRLRARRRTARQPGSIPASFTAGQNAQRPSASWTPQVRRDSELCGPAGWSTPRPSWWSDGSGPPRVAG